MQKLLLLSLLFPLITLAQTSKTLINSAEVYPDSVWEKIPSPTEYGWDADKLKQLRGFIIDSAHTTGMLVIQKGKVLFEFGDIQELSYLATRMKENADYHVTKVLLDKTKREKGQRSIEGTIHYRSCKTERCSDTTFKAKTYHF